MCRLGSDPKRHICKAVCSFRPGPAIDRSGVLCHLGSDPKSHIPRRAGGDRPAHKRSQIARPLRSGLHQPPSARAGRSPTYGSRCTTLVFTSTSPTTPSLGTTRSCMCHLGSDNEPPMCHLGSDPKRHIGGSRLNLNSFGYEWRIKRMGRGLRCRENRGGFWILVIIILS